MLSIDVRELPEPVAKVIETMVQTLRRQMDHGNNRREDRKPVQLSSWPGTVIGNLRHGRSTTMPNDPANNAKMDSNGLNEWLRQPRSSLTEAITQCVRDHVHALLSQGTNFYGYALLPGEPYDISSIVAAYNCESDIAVPKTDAQYRYYRFSVDEWAHYDPDVFESAKRQLAELKAQFADLHQKQEDTYDMDEFEISHAYSLLESVLQGIEAAKTEGVFGNLNPFLTIWISDSSERIMAESVRRLNPPAIVSEFMAEFG